MFDSFFYLSRAGSVNASCSRFVFNSNNYRSANRAYLRHVELFFCSGSLGYYHLDDFWNHVSGSLNQHFVANSNVFFGNLIFVVKCCPADHRPPNIHRIKVGHRRQGAGTSNLNFYPGDPRRFLQGFKLISKGPPWAAGGCTQQLLHRKAVDFNHHTIYIIG